MSMVCHTPALISPAITMQYPETGRHPEGSRAPVQEGVVAIKHAGAHVVVLQATQAPFAQWHKAQLYKPTVKVLVENELQAQNLYPLQRGTLISGVHCCCSACHNTQGKS